MNSIHERQGAGAMREIPPTTIQGRMTALEMRVKDLQQQNAITQQMIDTMAAEIVALRLERGRVGKRPEQHDPTQECRK